MSDCSVTLVLSACEARVVKGALLVEIAMLENRMKVDCDPQLWLPSLSAARRVFAVLCDKANKHLLDF